MEILEKVYLSISTFRRLFSPYVGIYRLRGFQTMIERILEERKPATLDDLLPDIDPAIKNKMVNHFFLPSRKSLFIEVKDRCELRKILQYATLEARLDESRNTPYSIDIYSEFEIEKCMKEIYEDMTKDRNDQKDEEIPDEFSDDFFDAKEFEEESKVIETPRERELDHSSVKAVNGIQDVKTPEIDSTFFPSPEEITVAAQKLEDLQRKTEEMMKESGKVIRKNIAKYLEWSQRMYDMTRQMQHEISQ